MIGLVTRLAANAIAPLRFAARRAIAEAAMLAVAILLVLVAVVFALIALTSWLSLQVGFIYATLIMCGAFIVAAAIALLIRAGMRRRPGLAAVPPPSTAAMGSMPGAGFRPEDLAMIATRDLVKGLTPFQLALVAALAGFIGGRMLDRK